MSLKRRNVSYVARSSIRRTQYFLAAKSESARRDAKAAVAELAEFGGKLRASVSRTALLHYVYMLLDPDRLDALLRDLEARIAG